MSITRDGMRRGPVRAPVNAFKEGANSIHNDQVAGSLGFRGGTIPGSVHMDQFPPLLVDVFGQRWFETGSLSLQFKNATIDAEPVVAFVGEPPAGSGDDVQVPVRMEREDGLLVAEGTASVGRPGEPSHLHSIDLRPSDPSDLRMFPHLEAGGLIAEYDEALALSEAVARAEAGRITEPLDWYVGDSPWGGPIASPSSVVRLLWRRSTGILTRSTGGAVGLFGSIEVRHIDGPLMMDREYHVESRVAAAGASPKTEYVWFDAVASEGGRDVASMRMQLRWMKASSSLFSEGS